MILKNTSIGFLAIVLLLPFCAKAQDTLSLYSTIYNQIDPVRTFNQEYYYNPAYLPDYSNYSFSDIQLRYKTLNKEYYLLQEGKSTQQASFEASSYKTKKTIKHYGELLLTSTQK